MMINTMITLKCLNFLIIFFPFQVKAQYNIMMDSIKQTSFQGLQGELDSHMDTLSGQVRTHQAQQALSLHKVDMEASVMEVSCKWNQGSGVQKCSEYSVPNYMCDTRCFNLTKLICKTRPYS